MWPLYVLKWLTVIDKKLLRRLAEREREREKVILFNECQLFWDSRSPGVTLCYGSQRKEVDERRTQGRDREGSAISWQNNVVSDTKKNGPGRLLA